MQSIVTFTINPAIDTSTSVPIVVPDHKMRCQAPRHDPGGGGINVSRAILRLGGDSLAMYLAGGPTGDLLYRLLEKEGVRQQQVKMTAWTREDIYVMEEETRHQYRFVMPGAAVSEAEWQTCLAQIDALPDAPT